MLSFGLIGLLMPVRLTTEAIDTNTIGMILSMYAVGMMLGGLYSRRLIARVGHIRIFSVAAALAGISILLCSLTMNVWVWGGTRMAMGFSIGLASAVIDGWLSDVAENKTRGRILALNQVVVTLGFFSGQFLINIAPVNESTLFTIAGILFSIALLPLMLTRRTAPMVTEMTVMTFNQLILASPLGIVCAIFSGMLYGSVINMLPLFANHYNISGLELSIFMASALLGGFIFQFPVGVLSDRFDRRTVLSYLLGLSMLVTLLAPYIAELGYFYLLALSVAMMTGVISCLYPMSISETFDRIKRSEMASAMSGLLVMYALGYILGSLLSSFSMSRFGNDALFVFLLTAQSLLFIFVLYRKYARAPLPVEEQEPYIPQQVLAMEAPYELDPRTQFSVHTHDNSPEVVAAVSLAEDDPASAVKLVQAIVQDQPDKTAELCNTLAQLENIDITRLYKAISKVAPEQEIEIIEELSHQSPEQVSDFIEWIALHRPNLLSVIVTELMHNTHHNQLDD